MTVSESSAFRFKPLTTSWVALHPQPQGVIFFIGGAFFGTFPTVFYRFLLKALFEQGYTLVALPFRFSFRHWSIALDLSQCKASIRQELLEIAQQMGYDDSLYRQDPNGPAFNYLWLGHSLGCKYIALLELLTDIEKRDFRLVLDGCIGQQQADRLSNSLSEVSLADISLFNQPSILLDPVISDLDNAVPLASLRKLLSRWIRVEPSRQQTYCVISRSQLFALSSLISFESQLGQSTVATLQELLGLQLADIQSLPLGRHLAAMGIQHGNSTVVDAVLQGIEKAKTRLTGGIRG